MFRGLLLDFWVAFALSTKFICQLSFLISSSKNFLHSISADLIDLPSSICLGCRPKLHSNNTSRSSATAFAGVSTSIARSHIRIQLFTPSIVGLARRSKFIKHLRFSSASCKASLKYAVRQRAFFIVFISSGSIKAR